MTNAEKYEKEINDILEADRDEIDEDVPDTMYIGLRRGKPISCMRDMCTTCDLTDESYCPAVIEEWLNKEAK